LSRTTSSFRILNHLAAYRWRGIEFVVKPYKDMKDVYTLGSLDEVLQALEDSKVTLSTILASRYVGGIRYVENMVMWHRSATSSVCVVQEPVAFKHGCD
jgi:hypothetical protein